MRAAQVPVLVLLACLAVMDAAARPLTEAEAQAILDSASRETDRITIEHEWMPWCSVPEGRSRITQLGEIGSKQEIEAVARCFRLKVPPAVRTVVDGKERWSRECLHVDTPEVFTLRLFKGDSLLLELNVLAADCVGSEALVADSAIRVDKVAFAPLYTDLQKRLNEKKGEPGATDNPDSAQ